MDYRNLAERLDAAEGLDQASEPLHAALARALPPGFIKDALHGVWLGHPLHPVLTDLPIGFWTSAWLLDIVGGEETDRAAEALVGWGVVSALPTAAAGLADWSELLKPERRTGLVHAVANLAATGLYALSYVARRRGHRSRGVALGWAGATAATLGGYLGGHLTFRRAAGVNQTAFAPAPDDWVRLELDGPLTDAPTLGRLDGEPIVVVGRSDGHVALADRCSHLGGPLHEGEVVDECIRCPWHASTFRLDDGSVRRGPATAPQPAYEVRVVGDDIEVRRAPPP